jgi:hypothetical protein
MEEIHIDFEIIIIIICCCRSCSSNSGNRKIFIPCSLFVFINAEFLHKQLKYQAVYLYNKFISILHISSRYRIVLLVSNDVHTYLLI